MESREILEKHVVVEGHRDVYEQLYRVSLGEPSPLRDAIAPRLIRDGINVCVYAISGDSYSHSQNTGRYLETALENIDMFLQEAPRSEGMIQLVKTRGDLPREVEPGTVKFLLHFEGCMPLRGSIENLRNFYRLGLRSLQPVWNFRNELGDGVWETRTGGGLTNFGVAVIKEANRLGMVVDLSHMNRQGFFQALEVAEAPLIVSHANACGMLDNPRNLADDQIKAIAAQGGLVGILALPERVAKQDAALDDLLRHMDYMIRLAGIEHVALGMDFVKYDGPRTLKDRHHPLHKPPLVKGFEEVEDLPNLIDGLQQHGYREHEIALILGGNYLRVLQTILPEQPVI
ncbi:MAG TPA: membrane dipeptidase [Candidatus Eisenbacteria bacterium]|nr:membrane dipeptidase [Candidatus Eisenbacteria bacterium]